MAPTDEPPTTARPIVQQLVGQLVEALHTGKKRVMVFLFSVVQLLIDPSTTSERVPVNTTRLLDALTQADSVEWPTIYASECATLDRHLIATLDLPRDLLHWLLIRLEAGPPAQRCRQLRTLEGRSPTARPTRATSTPQ
ncbi:MAG: hypothetical protein R3F65_25495 [bacterium]